MKIQNWLHQPVSKINNFQSKFFEVYFEIVWTHELKCKLKEVLPQWLQSAAVAMELTQLRIVVPNYLGSYILLYLN